MKTKKTCLSLKSCVYCTTSDFSNFFRILAPNFQVWEEKLSQLSLPTLLLQLFLSLAFCIPDNVYFTKCAVQTCKEMVLVLNNPPVKVK